MDLMIENKEKIAGEDPKSVNINLIILLMEQHGLLPRDKDKKARFRQLLAYVDDTGAFLEIISSYNK